MSARPIQLRGVRVHNLRDVDLDLPSRQLIAFCGVSGSGKTSLALDTLYAEGQRRYIASFSAYTRQFLQRLDKPDAERIEGIPPAVAVTHKDRTRSSRTTVGAATEIDDYLRLLYAKIGHVFCHGCGRHVRRESPETATRRLEALPPGTRFMLAFPRMAAALAELRQIWAEFREHGFVRCIADQRICSTADAAPEIGTPCTLLAVVDRLVAHRDSAERIRDSLETAFEQGNGRCVVLSAERAGDTEPPLTVDQREWYPWSFGNSWDCPACGLVYAEPEPKLFSFNSPLGACPECEGFGNVVEIDMNLVVPDPSKTLRAGAIAPWNTKTHADQLSRLVALAPDYDLPLDIPYSALTPAQRRLIRAGIPDRDFGGLDGFFAGLEQRKHKMHVRVFLSRWRSSRPCPVCQGARLQPAALAARVGGRNIAELTRAKIGDSYQFLRDLELSPWERDVGRTMLEQVLARLRFLLDVGLDYLTLDRTLRTVSGGEAQRVALTTALGSSLVNMLYVLDEPSVGLHPRDISRLVDAIKSLRSRDNTVVVVEHEEALLRAADRIVELGPGAGERGGRITFEGTREELLASTESLTGDYLCGRRGAIVPQRRQPNHGWIRLTGARGNNLKNLTVEFPLGVLCLVTGVSGAGKSSLVQDTLYGALCHRKRKDVAAPLGYDDVYGDGQIDDVIMVDQSPIGRSPRSNPVTYVKAFDEIRAVFADTLEARTRNYSAGHFSFNVDGGRCTGCNGDGHVEIDMQFLADVYMRCDECGGTRYRKEILDVAYRGRNIADVLEMTVREAFAFFRGQAKVQERLKRLIDVGLDYLRLGQRANTLSAGEAQRLKLAAYVSSARRHRTMFIMDEPTTGLHFADVVQLLDCFDALLNIGHSLIVVEHNLQLMKAADYIIDLGPGAAEDGGSVVVQGTPEKVANCERSVTGRFLAEALAETGTGD